MHSGGRNHHTILLARALTGDHCCAVTLDRLPGDVAGVETVLTCQLLPSAERYLFAVRLAAASPTVTVSVDGSLAAGRYRIWQAAKSVASIFLSIKSQGQTISRQFVWHDTRPGLRSRQGHGQLDIAGSTVLNLKAYVPSKIASERMPRNDLSCCDGDQS